MFVCVYLYVYVHACVCGFIETYFGSVNNGGCVGLGIVTASTATRLMTTDQLEQKEKQPNKWKLSEHVVEHFRATIFY